MRLSQRFKTIGGIEFLMDAVMDAEICIIHNFLRPEFAIPPIDNM